MCILIIDDQLLRQRQVEVGRLPSIAGGVREIGLVGPDMVDEKLRKLLQLKFVLLKFFLQLFLRKLQTLCLSLLFFSL